MSKIQLGIVGLGYWGPNLLRNFLRVENCNVAFCCDISKKNLNDIKKAHPTIKITDSYKKLLTDKKIDAVAIATPSNTHKRLVIQALKAGKHVLVEKPLALSHSDASEMHAWSKKVKKILMVGHTYEYNPAVEYLKHYIKNGELGKIYYIYSNRVNLGKIREETNALWNLAPHDFSVLYFILRMLPIEIAAFGGKYLQKNHEDVVFISLRFPKGIAAHIQVSWLDPNKKRSMTIVGSKKMIVFDDMNNEAPVKIYDKGVYQSAKNKSQEIFGEFKIKLRSGDIVMPYIKPEEPLYKECAHFVDCISKNVDPRSNGDVGLQIVKMLEKAQQSLDEGGIWIPL